MNKKIRNKSVNIFLIILLVLLVVLSNVAMYNVGLARSKVSISEKEAINNMPVVANIFSTIDQHYYKDVDWSKVQYNAAQGMLSGLDHYSRIEPRQIMQSIMPLIGLNIRQNIYSEYFIDGFFDQYDPTSTTYISGPGALDESEKVLKRGDMISKVKYIDQEGKEVIERVNGLQQTNYIKLMSATPNALNMMVEREGIAGELEFSVIKKIMDTESVLYKQLNATTGYIRLDEFDQARDSDKDPTSKIFKEKVDLFKASGSKNLILDLRYNPGGDLNELFAIASFFVAKEKIEKLPLMQMVYKKNKENLKLDDNAINYIKGQGGEIADDWIGSYVDDFKLVILTSKNTASAAEALIGIINCYTKEALKGQVGEKTFGKGVAQQGFNIGQNLVMYLTTAEYKVPIEDGESFKSVDQIGFLPDKYVDLNQRPKANMLEEEVFIKALEYFV